MSVRSYLVSKVALNGSEPVSAAQKQVLAALRLNARSFVEATKLFDELGLMVFSRETDRGPVPQIVLAPHWWGAAERRGLDIQAIAQWID